jgi:monoamine oxidase
MSSVVVIGAGLAGLAAARRLGYMEGAVRSGEATADTIAALAR